MRKNFHITRHLSRMVSLIFLFVIFCSISFPQVRGDFKTITSGNWNSAPTWQMFDGSIWKDTTTTPGETNSVFIGNNHSVTLTQTESCNNLNMHTGDNQNRLTTGGYTLNVNGKLRAYTGSAPGVSTTALPSTNYWINTSGGGRISVIGTGRYITNSGEWGGNPPGWRIEVALNPGENGVFNTSLKAAHITISSGDVSVTRDNAIFPDSGVYATGTLTIQSGASLRMKAGVLQRLLFSGANSHFARLVVDGILAFDSTVVGIVGAAVINFNGTVAYTANGAQTFLTRGTNTNSAYPNAYTILELNGSGTKTLGLNTTVNATLKLAGTSSFSLGSFALTYGGSSTLEYAGSAAQTTADAELPAAGAAPNLTINNANGVTLHNSRTVNDQLALTDGIISTGSNTLSVGSAGSVSRTNGHVDGKLEKYIPTGSPVVTYEIGDENNYTPVDLSFNEVTTEGEITAETVAGDHPELGTSRIDGGSSVNRYWALENSGVGFSTYDAVFNFVGSDVDAGAVPDDFIAEKYDSPDWAPATTGAKTSMSTEVTGLTSMSDFAIGEIKTHTITATAGSHGSIIPSGVIEVGEGEDQQFLIIPNGSYYVDSLIVDGVLVDSTLSYTFYNVTENHTIIAVFKVITHTITATAGLNGTVTPSGVIVVTHGENQGFNIAADHGYEIDSVLVDGIYVGNISFYEFENITSDHAIEASFSAIKYVTSEFTTYDGWNLISVPVVPDDFRKTVLFPTALSDAYAYTGMYEVRDTLNNREGYWLKFGAVQGISVTGTPRETDTIGVVAGWNLIGSLSEDISTASIIPIGTTIESYFFNFNNGYQATDSIKIGNGVWIKVSNPGTLVLSSGVAGNIIMKQSSDDIRELDILNTLRVADDNNNNRLLYFGKLPSQSNSPTFYELPPSPPVGTFDVRFSDNRYIAGYTEGGRKASDYAINIQPTRWPVTLSWTLMPDEQIGYYLEYKSNGKLRKIDLAGDRNSVTLTESEGSSVVLKITSVEIPKEYVLEQNYPNPFNPTTKIRFALPVKSVVNLKIYNLLGQEVATLYDGQLLDAGYTEVEFGSEKLSTGIYFIKFTADGLEKENSGKPFTSVKKMIYGK